MPTTVSFYFKIGTFRHSNLWTVFKAPRFQFPSFLVSDCVQFNQISLLLWLLMSYYWRNAPKVFQELSSEVFYPFSTLFGRNLKRLYKHVSNFTVNIISSFKRFVNASCSVVPQPDKSLLLLATYSKWSLRNDHIGLDIN